MKERDRQRIAQSLQQLDAWRASGMALKAYCESNGHSFTQWRAWLGVEHGWRAALGESVTTPGFVQAVVGGANQLGAGAGLCPSTPGQTLRITLQREAGTLQATVHAPLAALGRCAALLREVLA